MKHFKTIAFRVLLLGFFLGAFVETNAQLNFDWRGYNTDNWHDPTNWDINGTPGTVTDPIPGPTDDVDFDIGSTVPVNIYLGHATCQNLTFTNTTPISLNGTRPLIAYGNVALLPTPFLTWNLQNRFILQNSAPATMTTAGQVFINDVVIRTDGSTTLTLLDGLITARQVEHETGELILAPSQWIQAMGYHGWVSGGTRHLTLGASSVMILDGSYQSGNNDSYPWLSRGMTFTANSSTIEFTGEYAHMRAFDTHLNGVLFSHSNAPNGVGFATISGDAVIPNTFNFVRMESHSRILCNNVFNALLELAAGHHHVFGAGRTQEFLSSGFGAGLQLFWAGMSPCPSFTTFESSFKGQLTYMSSPLNHSVDRVIMKDIAATGGGVFTATNSYGTVTENPGWVFGSAPPSQVLFWRGPDAALGSVGDGISWSDAGNWSLTPSPMPISPVPCAPGPMDDVVFTAGAFSAMYPVVEIDVNYAYCRALQWDNNIMPGAIFRSQGNVRNRILGVRGDLRFTAVMNMDFVGLMHFQDQPANFGPHTGSIIMDSKRFTNDVHFNGCAGNWTLQDNFETSGLNTNITISGSNGGIIYLDYGTLNTGGNPVTCRSFVSNNTHTRELNMSNSLITLTGQDNVNGGFYAWNWQHGDGSGGLTMPYASHTAGSLIRFMEIGSLGVPLAGGMALEEVTFEKRGSIHGDNQFYGDVEFKSDGTVGYPPNYLASSADNEFLNSLVLARGKAYVFERGETQLFTAPAGDINAVGDCEEMIMMKSSHSGQLTNFNNQTGNTITVEYCVIQDIDETMGSFSPNFVANNSFMFNSPSNWQGGPGINQLIPLYWIGGNTGDDSWTNGANWSRSSGGPPEYCVPSPGNDAVFDDNSFNGGGNYNVTVDGCNVYCHNFNWHRIFAGPMAVFRDNNSSSNAMINMHVYGGFDAANSTGSGALLDIQYDDDITFETDGDAFDYIQVGTPNILQSRLYFNGHDKIFRQKSHIETTKEEYLTVGTHDLDVWSFKAHRFFGYPQGILDMSDPASPQYTLSGTYDLGLDLHTWNSYNGFDLKEGAGFVIFESPDEPSLYAEDNIEFATVMFTDPSGDGYCRTNNFYDRLQFRGNGFIQGENIFKEELMFTPGRTYTLTSYMTQALINNATFAAMGAPSAPIIVQASVPGVESIIIKTDPEVCTDWLILSDIHNLSPPTVPFYAGLNSVNAGGNVGWIFDECGSILDVTICDGMTFNFPQPPVGLTYAWDFADGSTSTLGNPAHVFAGPGTYNVVVDAFAPPNFQWRYQYNVTVEDCCDGMASQWPVQEGSTTTPELANDIAVDANDNVFVTGQHFPGSVFGGIPLGAGYGFVARYDDCGTLMWIQVLPNDGAGVRLKLSPDEQSLYVISNPQTQPWELDILEYDVNTGMVIWASKITSTTFVRGTNIDVDDQRLYITGTFIGQLNSTNIANLTAVTTDGFVAYRPLNQNNWTQARQLWSTAVGGSVNTSGLSVSDDGIIYVTGQFRDEVCFAPGTGSPNKIISPGDNAYLAKYNTLLNIVSNTSPAGRFNYSGVAVDNVNERVIVINDNLFGTTAYIEAFEEASFATPFWTTTYGFGTLREGYTDLVISHADAHEGVLVSGARWNTMGGGNFEVLTRKQNLETGADVWPPQLSTGPNWSLKHETKTIDVADEGHLIYTGGGFQQMTFFGGNSMVTAPFDMDMFLVRMHDNVIGSIPQYYKFETGTVEEEEFSTKVSVSPNPTSGQLMLEIDMPGSEKVTLRVVDFYGRVIREEDFYVNQTSRSTLDLSGEASGIYFVSVYTEEGFTTQKVVLTD